MNKSKKPSAILKVAIIWILLLLAGFYLMHPLFKDFRNTVYDTVIRIFVLAGLGLYSTLSPKIKMPLPGKIVVWIYLVMRALFMVLTVSRFVMLFYFLYSVANAMVSICLYVKYKKSYAALYLWGLLSFIISINVKVKYLGDTSILFVVSGICAVVAFIPCLIFGILKFRQSRNYSKIIGIPLLGIMLGFGLPFAELNSMNVYLDRSEPVYESFLIVDKKSTTGGGTTGTKYEFKFEKGEEWFWMDVYYDIYTEHEVGDYVYLSKYDGFFFGPFYTLEY